MSRKMVEYLNNIGLFQASSVVSSDHEQVNAVANSSYTLHLHISGGANVLGLVQKMAA